jgi:hypothetical protein
MKPWEIPSVSPDKAFFRAAGWRPDFIGTTIFAKPLPKNEQPKNRESAFLSPSKNTTVPPE